MTMTNETWTEKKTDLAMVSTFVNASHTMRSIRLWCLPSYLLALVIFFLPLKVTSLFVTSTQRRQHHAVCWNERRCQLFNSPQDILEPESWLDIMDRNLLSNLVRRRAEARARGDYAEADALKDEIYEDFRFPDGVHLEIRDVPRREGGGSTWKLIRTSLVEPLQGPTVLQLAHAALGIAMASSENSDADGSSQQLNTLVDQAKKRLKQTEAVQLELRGRKAADAAFWFALAGVTDTFVMESLANICAKELERFGSRPSCRPKDILHVTERLAAAGIRSNAVLQRAVLAILASKEHSLNPCDLLKFHSDHSLVMIWKFSTRQRKQRAFLKSALQHWERHSGTSNNDTSFAVRKDKAPPKANWSDLYNNSTRPLVVDIGCGMGVSLLGLAQCHDDSASSLGDWSEYNYAGVDLSGLAIGYARGVSYRWGLEDRLQFFVDDAESFMKWVVDSYPGPVRFCFLQFPTPYRLQVSDVTNDNNESLPPASERKGNLQLPSDVTSGFMVTKHLVRLIHCALQKGCANGTLLIQSNCEDVAVWMSKMACDEIGFKYMQSHSEPEIPPPKIRIRTPKRTLDWIAMSGERAKGKGWRTRAILPRMGRTETEVACMLNGTPIHRCLLVPVESAV